jgi:hypothetical protein
VLVKRILKPESAWEVSGVVVTLEEIVVVLTEVTLGVMVVAVPEVEVVAVPEVEVEAVAPEAEAEAEAEVVAPEAEVVAPEAEVVALVADRTDPITRKAAISQELANKQVAIISVRKNPSRTCRFNSDFANLNHDRHFPVNPLTLFGECKIG